MIKKCYSPAAYLFPVMDDATTDQILRYTIKRPSSSPNIEIPLTSVSHAGRINSWLWRSWSNSTRSSGFSARSTTTPNRRRWLKFEIGAVWSGRRAWREASAVGKVEGGRQRGWRTINGSSWKTRWQELSEFSGCIKMFGEQFQVGLSTQMLQVPAVESDLPRRHPGTSSESQHEENATCPSDGLWVTFENIFETSCSFIWLTCDPEDSGSSILRMKETQILRF